MNSDWDRAGQMDVVHANAVSPPMVNILSFHGAEDRCVSPWEPAWALVEGPGSCRPEPHTSGLGVEEEGY